MLLIDDRLHLYRPSPRCSSQDQNGEDGGQQQHLDYGRFRYCSEFAYRSDWINTSSSLAHYLFFFLNHTTHIYFYCAIPGIVIIDQPPSRFYTYDREMMLYHYSVLLRRMAAAGSAVAISAAAEAPRIPAPGVAVRDHLIAR